MKKILVTTDFSANSKSGIRFAMQLATQHGFELIFYHAVELLKPTSWSQDRYNKYAANEINRHENRLEQFINGIFKKSVLPPAKYKCEGQMGIGFEDQVVSYAKKIKADFICISTRGAGKIEKLFGTNASAVIATSTVPVIVVPHTYRIKPIINIWYASDLLNFEKELKTIRKFADALNATIEVIHYDHLIELEESKNKFAEIQSKYSSEDLQFYFKKLDFDQTLISCIQRDIKKAKPSLLALFTKQDLSWFDRLFLPSSAVELSFDIKIPMLVFRK